jgi:hemerythrin
MKYLFEWTPAISVNDNIIDGQHQRLLGQVNTLLSYIISEKNDAIVIDSVTFLDQYINEHFAYEEEYMREHKYPEIENHIKYHKNFIEHYKKFKEKLLSGVSRESLALEIEQYIGNWWLTHIGVEDHKYAEFIKTQEEKK